MTASSCIRISSGWDPETKQQTFTEHYTVALYDRNTTYQFPVDEHSAMSRYFYSVKHLGNEGNGGTTWHLRPPKNVTAQQKARWNSTRDAMEYDPVTWLEAHISKPTVYTMQTGNCDVQSCTAWPGGSRRKYQEAQCGTPVRSRSQSDQTPSGTDKTQSNPLRRFLGS
jgi:hypothetical protein